MQTNLLYQPVSTMAQIHLQPGEQLEVEPGAMIGMSTNIQMTTGMANNSQSKGGGLLGKIASAASKMLTGESFFQNTFTAQGGPGELLLSHTLPGDMCWIELPQAGIKVQSTAYIANTVGTGVNAEMGGAKTFFGGEGLFVLNCMPGGPGSSVLLGAFGGIQEMQCDGNLIIDNGHLVAWDNTLTFNVQKAAGGFIASFLSGEGMVCKFTGQGRIWIQTRNPSDYGMTVGGLLPPRSN